MYLNFRLIVIGLLKSNIHSYLRCTSKITNTKARHFLRISPIFANFSDQTEYDVGGPEIDHRWTILSLSLY